MARALNAIEFLGKKFETLAFTDKWKDSFGEPERNFSMIIYGRPKNGKTEFAIMLSKYLTRFSKVLYNSFEQGFSKSLQDAFRRQNMQDVGKNILVIHKEKFDNLVVRLKKKKSPNVVVIDSLQYIKLTSDQWKFLRTTFPRKVFILIAHAEGDQPKGNSAKEIEYDIDIMCLVKGYKAYPGSRFGGNEPFLIYEKGHNEWLLRQQKFKAIPKQKSEEKVPELPFDKENKATETVPDLVNTITETSFN